MKNVINIKFYLDFSIILPSFAKKTKTHGKTNTFNHSLHSNTGWKTH